MEEPAEGAPLPPPPAVITALPPPPAGGGDTTLALYGNGQGAASSSDEDSSDYESDSDDAPGPLDPDKCILSGRRVRRVRCTNVAVRDGRWMANLPAGEVNFRSHVEHTLCLCDERPLVSRNARSGLYRMGSR